MMGDQSASSEQPATTTRKKRKKKKAGRSSAWKKSPHASLSLYSGSRHEIEREGLPLVLPPRDPPKPNPSRRAAPTPTCSFRPLRQSDLPSSLIRPPPFRLCLPHHPFHCNHLLGKGGRRRGGGGRRTTTTTRRRRGTGERAGVCVRARSHGSHQTASSPGFSSRRGEAGGRAAAMGSFVGHALPGTLFLVVGLWHVWSAVCRHAADPKSFRVRVWSPAPDWLAGGRLAHLELYVVVGGSLVDLCIELLYSTHLRVFVDGGVLNPSHMNDFEHAGMLLMFFLFGAAALLSQTTRFLPLPEGVLCLLGAAAFSAEYLLFYFHSTAHKGLEGYYHLLLVLLVGLCVASAVAGALLPTSFPADLCNGIAVTLQGLWFYQTAFVLYGPMMPEGCRLEDNQITCRPAGSEVRGELLATFQLFALVLLVLAAAVVMYGVAASKYGNPEVLSKLHAAESQIGSSEEVE